MANEAYGREPPKRKGFMPCRPGSSLITARGIQLSQAVPLYPKTGQMRESKEFNAGLKIKGFSSISQPKTWRCADEVCASCCHMNLSLSLDFPEFLTCAADPHLRFPIPGQNSGNLLGEDPAQSDVFEGSRTPLSSVNDPFIVCGYVCRRESRIPPPKPPSPSPSSLGMRRRTTSATSSAHPRVLGARMLGARCSPS